MIGGAFTANVFGTDIDLSAVGRGMVTLNGSIAKGANNDASYSVNGGAPEAFPPFMLTFPLVASPSSGGG
jgi:hypothetical protein